MSAGKGRSPARPFGGTDLAEQRAPLPCPSSEGTIPPTGLSHPPPGTHPLARGNAPHRLKGGREVKDAKEALAEPVLLHHTSVQGENTQ